MQVQVQLCWRSALSAGAEVQHLDAVLLHGPDNTSTPSYCTASEDATRAGVVESFAQISSGMGKAVRL